ncbi:hypothetical protein [Oscillatoria salina]|uniref:hypothetical protein n=1 Tax=Oscillatoria salina TaxID=331517 RepID=UPI0013BC3B2C|nr:hypothetical protein [Oscillatoria salina]MBZ8178732.1 hypothetical protein [Oscillatoria salina IIICB1]NET89366.1 hypothetical protein [Kamptonema sp. SIO1D9]
MVKLICPGIHSPQLTDSFVQQLCQNSEENLKNFIIFPAQERQAYSAIDIFNFLESNVTLNSNSSVLFIAFSAGVVGAMGAALGWQMQKRKVKALIAFDGWGMPLAGNFPIHRVSHDYFTHWSSALLGAGEDSFYAEPSVKHLALWANPQATLGWWVKSSGCRVRCSTREFLTVLLKRYEEEL